MRKRFVVYECINDNWRWHLIGANGEIMAQGEPHPTEKLARAAISRVKRSVFAPVEKLHLVERS